MKAKSQNIIFFGKHGSGKSALITRIVKRKPCIENAATKIQSFETERLYGEKVINYKVLDTQGFTELLDLTDILDDIPNIKDSDFGVYCIDLQDEQPNLSEIQENINKFKEKAPKAVIIIVGTKSDPLVETLNPLTEDYKVIITDTREPSKTNGLAALSKALFQGFLKTESEWGFALAELDKITDKIKDLVIKESLEDQVDEFVIKIQDKKYSYLEKAEMIEDFQKKMSENLENAHPELWTAVSRLATVALITLLAGLLGFAIGFALGAWSGPGALITATVAGSGAAYAAVAVMTAGTIGLTLGVISTGMLMHGFFQEHQEKDKLDNFITKTKAMVEDEEVADLVF